MLELQMGAGDTDAELLSELLLGKLYAVQHHAGRGVADGVEMNIPRSTGEKSRSLDRRKTKQ